jgi:hypothetical protein
MTRDLGDFQTPPTLVEEILTCLTRNNRSWKRVLEPTCGRGNFIRGLLQLAAKPDEIQGIELQKRYVQEASTYDAQKLDVRISVHQANIFHLNLSKDLKWQQQGSSLLVIGNPPWITNAELGSLESSNLPVKTNLKGLSGFEAMTGSSNFDIAEYIWLKLIWELSSEEPTIALLCKTSVARNILQFAYKTNLPIGNAALWKIDSKKYFGAMVDACLFCIEVNHMHQQYQAQVYPDLTSVEPEATIGIIHGHLVSDVNSNLAFIRNNGTSPFTWRQGLKHDAASVMELIYDTSGKLYNKLGEIVNIETEYFYPLLKSSDLGGQDKVRPRKAVIVPQKRISEDTTLLERQAPKLWQYLIDHISIFDNRKSSIYERQPPFSIFGIGNYSFALFKVAISGMYKQVKFRAIGPLDGKPVMFDDTCYFLPCISAQQAAFIASLLNDPLSIAFVHSLSFRDAKRPITKKLLQSINLAALLDAVDRAALLSRATNYLIALIGESQAQQTIWPHDLQILLSKQPDEGVHTIRDNSVTCEAIQLQLI